MCLNGSQCDQNKQDIITGVENTLKLAGSSQTYAYYFDTADKTHGIGVNRFILLNQPALIQYVIFPFSNRKPEQVTIEAYHKMEMPGIIIFDGIIPWEESDFILNIPNIPVIAVSFRCNRKSVVREHFMEWYPKENMVNYDILDGITIYGINNETMALEEPPAPGTLEIENMETVRSKSIRMNIDSKFVMYQSDYMRIGFSLIRPCISFLAWDSLGTGRPNKTF